MRVFFLSLSGVLLVLIGAYGLIVGEIRLDAPIAGLSPIIAALAAPPSKKEDGRERRSLPVRQMGRKRR